MLLDHEDAGARVIGDRAEGGNELFDDDRRQAETHLVDHQQPRSTDEGTGQSEHLLLSSRQ